MFPHRAFLDFKGRRLQGARPFAVFETTDGAWTWTIDDATSSTRSAFQNGAGDVLSELQRALNWCKTQHPSGGAIGFFSYEFARQIEPRAFSQIKLNELKVPDARWVFYAEIADEEPPQREFQANIEYSNFDAAQTFGRTPCAPTNYADAIATILDFIAHGDIYQANYTRRFSRVLPCSPFELLERLRAQNPSPFAAFLEYDDFSIVSNSPEKFLSLEDRVLESEPIKGTMRRGIDEREDDELKKQLQNSEKDRAENVMIVDLLRNDLGRVCEFGSVHVPRLFDVQTFANLHHLVSTVRGNLRPNCDAIDAIRAAFPCGSITGAPKIRAMQILDELENCRRGVAMGSIGLLRFNGDMILNVAIRTVTCVGDQAFFHVGGGIVSDSICDDEYAEMQLKARAIENALQQQSAPQNRGAL